MKYLMCYDITDPKRLRKTAKILESYGIRVQKSFFQIDISEKRMEELKNKILKAIKTKKDKYFIYPICEECCRRAITDGTGSLITLEDFEII